MKSENPRIPPPKPQPNYVRAAVLHVISLAQLTIIWVAQLTIAHARSWSVNYINGRVRLRAEPDRAIQDLALFRDEKRIKDALMALINPHRRPHYPPSERLAILELKAARGWSLEQTARVFHVTHQRSLRGLPGWVSKSQMRWFKRVRP